MMTDQIRGRVRGLTVLELDKSRLLACSLHTTTVVSAKSCATLILDLRPNIERTMIAICTDFPSADE
jgi:hypothetical protein